MYKLSKKIIILVPSILILISFYSCNILEINYYNVNKYIFLILFISLVLIISIKRYSLCLDLYNLYYFKLHIILYIIWIFSLFLYKVYLISLIVIIFNFIISSIMCINFYKIKKSILYIFYNMWVIYLIYFNILVLR